MREITILGFIAIFTFIASANTWAHFHTEKLLPIGVVLERLMSDRTVRIALGIAWWWVGWHFIFSEL